MVIRYNLLFLALLLALFILGCSTGGGTPIIPDAPPIPAVPSITTPDGDGRSIDGHGGSARIPLGYYSFNADPDAGTLDIESLRTVDFHLNAVPLLEDGAQHLVGLASPPQFSNGGKQLDVRIRIIHPNPDPVFTGFDVHGVLISKGTSGGWSDADIIVAGPGETRLMNPDGMTRWWNPKEFTNPGIYGYTPGELGTSIPGSEAATLNGYKTFADDLGPMTEMTDFDPASRGMFTAGGSNIRHYTISLKGGLQFNYAVDASWAFPNSVPPTPPGDFPPRANMPEPFLIDVDEWLNTLWWQDGVGYGGNAFYYITIHDWQGAATIGGAWIEIPAVGIDGELTNLVEEGENYKRYEYILLQPALDSNDGFDVLISVDSHQGSYLPALTGVDKPLRAYQRHWCDVADVDPGVNLPPVGIMEAATDPDILIGESVTFDANDSYDPDGEIVDYAWDFDGDEVYGDSWDSGTSVNPTKLFNEYGIFNVRCRVEDNDGAFGFSLPVPVNVDFEFNQQPVAIAEATTPTEIVSGMSVTFDATASYDMDGTIESYEWDFDGDGHYGDAYDAGTDQVPLKFYYSQGIYEVDLRVVDNEDAEDFLEQTITITVENSPPTARAQFDVGPPYYIDIEYEISAGTSDDIDGTIDQYEWDVDYDGMTFNPTLFAEIINLQWDTPTTYSIMLRVTDNDGAQDFLDEPLAGDILLPPEITDIKVTYEDPLRVTWTIAGSSFGDIEGDIITDLPSGWDEQMVSWSNDEIVCKFPPYSMDITASVMSNSGFETGQQLVKESDGILVIYNTNSTVSGQIKDYYVSPVTGRGIPPEHVLGLDVTTSESISRANYDLMKSDIETWLVDNGVRYEVKYIATCKGIPLRIPKESGSDYKDLDYACVDSELTVLFESYNLAGRSANPYYEPHLPVVFHPAKHVLDGLHLRYLVTRLTGYTYEEVTAMIDRCLNPYQAGGGWYILDDDPGKWYDRMHLAYPLMQADGLNVLYDDTDVFVTADTIGDPAISDNIMGYCGHGIHHSPNPGTYYIINDLKFTYLNGALFNTYESFNGTTFTWENHSGHGMVGDFIRMGGSGGIGHVYEPWSDAVGNESHLYRWYERGYSLAETQYMALRYVSWVEVVVGEPLCRIAIWEG